MKNKDSETLLLELSLEEKIRKELDDVKLYFDYSEIESDNEDEVTLKLITISEIHGKSFMFHKIVSNSKKSCLDSMLGYIKSDYKRKFSNYEIVWRKKGDISNTISWFHGKDFLDIIDKFYFSKDSSEVIIWEVKLRPMS